MALRTFKIRTREEGESWKTETVKAYSPSDLISQYHMMGFDDNQIQILKELKTDNTEQKINNSNTISVGVDPNTLLSVTDLPKDVQKVVNTDIYNNNIGESSNDQPENEVQHIVNQKQSESSIVKEQQKSKPMFWKDGDTEFKLEDGQLYKRKWTEITISELNDNNIRILKNGDPISIVPLNYTIEKFEWIKVKQS